MNNDMDLIEKQRKELKLAKEFAKKADYFMTQHHIIQAEEIWPVSIKKKSNIWAIYKEAKAKLPKQMRILWKN